MVRPPIHNIGCGQAITFQLTTKILRNHFYPELVLARPNNQNRGVGVRFKNPRYFLISVEPWGDIRRADWTRHSTVIASTARIAGTMVTRAGLQFLMIRRIAIAWLVTLPVTILIAGGLVCESPAFCCLLIATRNGRRLARLHRLPRSHAGCCSCWTARKAPALRGVTPQAPGSQRGCAPPHKHHRPNRHSNKLPNKLR
jgi:hypothetical protein